jgi:hypothetical protein
MKYIAYWELDQDNMDAAIQKIDQITQMIEQNPQGNAKMLFPHMLLEIGYTGFSLIETDDPSTLGGALVMAGPEVKINFIPIYDAIQALETFKSVRNMMPRTTTTTTTERLEKTLNV